MRLTFLTGSLAGRTFEIPAAGLTIGRRDECDVRLDASDTVVSGLHARITMRNGAVVLRDEGSMNGTLVDGAVVIEAPLSHGQIIMFGRSGPTARLDVGAPVAEPLASRPRKSGLTGLYQAAREQASAGSNTPPLEADVIKTFVRLAHERSTQRWHLMLAGVVILGLVSIVIVYALGQRKAAGLEERLVSLSLELQTQGQAREALEAQLQQMADSAAAAARAGQSSRTEVQVRQQRDAVQQDRRFGPTVTQRFAAGVGMIQFQVGWHNTKHGWLRLRGTPDGDVQLTSDSSAPLALSASSHCTGFLVDAEGWVLTNRHCVDLAFPDGEEVTQGTLRLGKQGELAFAPAIASWRISFPPGRTFEVDSGSVRASQEHDLGAFRTTTRPDGVPVLPLARAEPVVAGEDVVLLAYPGGAAVTAQRRGLGSFSNSSLRDELRAATSSAAQRFADDAGVGRLLNSVPDDDSARKAFLKARPNVQLLLSTLDAVQDRAFFDTLARAGHVQPDVGGSISVSGVRPDSISFHTLGGIGGSSGGPLISSKLSVIGINHAGFARNDRGAQYQQNEAVPVEFALRFLPAAKAR
jgi:S1-C subfamily serine protease